MYLRTGAALRWRPTILAGEPSDMMRVMERDGVQLALLANGYECGFSMCWPPASRLILDLFVEEWSVTTGPVRARLEAAFEGARRKFIEQSPALITQAADYPDELPDAILLAVAIEGTAAHIAWIGGDIALLSRGFRTITSTTPHRLVEKLRREQPEGTDLSHIPNVLTRTVAELTTPRMPAECLTVDLEAGDTLLLMSCAASRGVGVSLNDAAFVATGHASPARAAELLADVAFASADPAYAAVVALRFDEVDVTSTLDRLIDKYEPDPKEGAWEQAWSQRQRALPVVYDLGGIIGMRNDGSVVSVPWAGEATREEDWPGAHLAAVIGAAQKYPELATLGPRRPADAEDCPQCAVLNPNGKGCPACWYLCWALPTPPSWYFDKSPRRAERGVVVEKRAWWRRWFGGRG